MNGPTGSAVGAGDLFLDSVNTVGASEVTNPEVSRVSSRTRCNIYNK
jgi:hypothetical protein